MSPEQVLLLTMIEVGMEIKPGTLQSLKESIQDGNIYFFDRTGIPTGFVTWFLEGDVLEVNNLCVYDNVRPMKLFELRKILHERYPNLSKVRWWDDKRKREVIYGFQQNEHDNRPVSPAENSSR